MVRENKTEKQVLDELLRLAKSWEGTAYAAMQYCANDALFMGEAKGLLSAAKELREYIQNHQLPFGVE